MKKTNNYVDNKALLQAIKRWRERQKLDPDAKPCNEIGKAILDIANNMVRRWNFSGYTPDWKERMVGDSIELTVRGIKNFDCDKYTNPHGYISSICWNACVERIKKERKASVIKYKYFVEEVFDADCADMSAHVDMDFYNDMIKKIAEYEESIKKKKSEKPEPIVTDVEDTEVLTGLELLYGKDF
ncbi:MAG: hypothetical protein ACRC9Y_10045 [Aeromonas veronii]